MTVDVDDSIDCPAYLCGRIMALLAMIQEEALGNVGAGVVQRYYAAAVLVHRQVELSAPKLTQFEGILHGDFAASCGEGLSLTAKVGMEGSRPS